MSNDDATVWITYNGEIYNYEEIREDLLARGHIFKTKSDTEVIIRLYEDIGERCVERLNGMFAFAIWDKRKEVLLLARDRIGIKPFYYFLGPNSLAFSSEIKALLQIESLQPKVNLQALHDYLTFRYTIAPLTMIEGILKLQPGYMLLAQNGTVKLQQYWDLDLSKKLKMEEKDYVNEFYSQFRASVKRHLVGEVPLGVLLSGGIDSTAVAAITADLAGERVKTFSVAFTGEDNPDYDERHYARLASHYYNTDHHEIAISRKEFVDGLQNYVWYMEEPMADSASIPLYYVAKLAKDYVTIILSGEGSDELLAGYMTWSDLKGFNRAQWIRKLPAVVRNRFISPLNDRFIRSSRVNQYLDLSNLPISHYPQVVPLYTDNVFSEAAKFELYDQRIKEAGHFRPSEDIVVDAYRRTTDFSFLDQMLYVSTKQWLPDDLLLKADKMTMAHSLELRVPFLDSTFVEFVGSLPVEMKLKRNGQRNYITKYILRKAFEDKMPQEILSRKKVGFAVPLKSLFKHELKTLAWEIFDSESFNQNGIFDKVKIHTLLRENEAGIDHSRRLWSLLVFSMWLKLFRVSI